MIQISSPLTSLTSGSLMASIFALQLTAVPVSATRAAMLDREVRISGSSSTNGTSRRKFVSAADEAVTLANFYEDLLARQQPLGRDFEEVLFENLWDLYLR